VEVLNILQHKRLTNHQIMYDHLTKANSTHTQPTVQISLVLYTSRQSSLCSHFFGSMPPADMGKEDTSPSFPPPPEM